jgi:hypothetical protein
MPVATTDQKATYTRSELRGLAEERWRLASDMGMDVEFVVANAVIIGTSVGVGGAGVGGGVGEIPDSQDVRMGSLSLC